MINSILTATKKALGIEADYDAFDPEITMHINTVFGDLHQLGVGTTKPFSIEDTEATWSDFFGEIDNINQVKSYLYLRLRLLFDPPTNSFSITSFKEQLRELEWRLNVAQDTFNAGIDETATGYGHGPYGT